jgi:hypothetical protein
MRRHHAAPSPATTRSHGLVAAATRRAPLATPVACKSRQVHGQREGLAELAGVAAGFQDAHPFPVPPGQVSVA